ncbi:MAG: Gfo/Idh/MocA family oxidoreductase [Planctomycetota bacterium]|nr:Gfo/Idh/MocA family oxidoreductase [Planctomycetota bacterium]
MDKVRIGAIGCGLRTTALLNWMLPKNDRLQVTAVCDISEKAAATVRKFLGGAPRIYVDYRDLLTDPSIQWVMIGSWNCLHAEQTVAAFRAGKNVFCEKPLATTIDDCLAMRDAWQASGKTFVLGYTLRYSAMYRKIKELIDSGAIGTPISLDFNETLPFAHGGYVHAGWRSQTRFSGPHVLEKNCHDIDMANWLLASLPVKAASFGGCNFFTPQYRRRIDQIGPTPDGKKAYCDWWNALGFDPPPADPFRADKDIADNLVAILEYANGVRASFHVNHNAGLPERRIYICGSEGAIRAGTVPDQIELGRIAWDTKPEIISTPTLGPHGGGDVFLAESIIASMVDAAPPVTSMIDGLTSAITCLAIDEAMRTASIVDLRPSWPPGKRPPYHPDLPPCPLIPTRARAGPRNLELIPRRLPPPARLGRRSSARTSIVRNQLLTARRSVLRCRLIQDNSLLEVCPCPTNLRPNCLCLAVGPRVSSPLSCMSSLWPNSL